MAVCEKIKIKHRKLCTGDMRDPIILQERSITAVDISQLDYRETFIDIAEIWSAVQTNRGFISFNDVGTNRSSTESQKTYTHKFYIRYTDEFLPTSQNFILWNSERYKIISVENIDERNEYYLFLSVKHGLDSVPANEA